MVAKRYGVLPSALLESGSSVDVHCAELAMAYENWVANNHKNGHKITSHTPEQLQAMIDRVNERTKDGKTTPSNK